MPDARFTQWQAPLQKSETSPSRSSSEPGGAIHSSIHPSVHQVTSLDQCYWTRIADFRTYRTEKDNTKTLFPGANPQPAKKTSSVRCIYRKIFIFFCRNLFFFRNWHLGTWGCKIFHSSLVLVLGPRLNFPGYMTDITPIIYWCYIRSRTKPVLLVEEGFGIDRLVSETPNWYGLQYYQDGSQYHIPGVAPYIPVLYPSLSNKYCYPNSKEFF
jgi:hypothetical protein